MMLFKLSLKNIKKSFKDYAIYFFTLILGVAIFYVFNAIESQSVLLKVNRSTQDIIKLMNTMLSGVSVFVSFVLGFLIIYASQFLMKRRKKEFGIYLTLGMSKRKISMILFFETILIGVISLIVGLGFGAVLSQLMSLLVANLFEADMTDFTFLFSTSSMVKTLVYFGIMYFFVMIFNTLQVRRCKLLDLLYSSKKSEQVKMKNPVACIFLFLLSCGMLGFAYYKVTIDVTSLQTAADILLPIALGSVATFLLFFSLSGLLLRIVRSRKKFYYKGLNSFTFRQISSKVNTTVFSMTIICLMLFVTICVLSSSLSIKNSMTATLKDVTPVDIQITQKRNFPLEEAANYGYTAEQAASTKRTIKENLELLAFDQNRYFQDQVVISFYATNAVTFKETLGRTFPAFQKEYPFMDFTSSEVFVKLSDYNKVAKLYGAKTHTLKEDEYFILADYENIVALRNEALKDHTEIVVEGKTLKPKYDHCIDGFLLISNSHTNTGLIIVPDAALSENILESDVLIANYKGKSKEEKEAVEDVIKDLENRPLADTLLLRANTKLELYSASIGLGALVTFLGLYLGIIFLLASAALLSLKELSESSDNIDRFQMLRRLGADEALIRKALFRQIAIFFAFPLLLAVIHSIFGLEFCKRILEGFGEEKLLASAVMTAIFLLAIYGGYFLVTYFCSKNIIKEKRTP